MTERTETGGRAAGRRDNWDGRGRTLGGLLAVTLRALVAELHRRLDAAGYADVRPGSGNVFETIDPEGTTVAVMARRAGVTAQAMVQVVDYLEARGYVERAPDPSDRRAKLVRLTDRGREADRVGRETIAAIEREWAALLDDDRLAHLRAALEDLAVAFDTRG